MDSKSLILYTIISQVKSNVRHPEWSIECTDSKLKAAGIEPCTVQNEGKLLV